MHKFDPRNMERLMRKDRLGKASPEGLLRGAGLKDGDRVVDIGCGPGFFSIPAAAIVGPEGRVYAVDTEEVMLESLRQRNLAPNVVPLKSGEHSIPVDSSEADFALFAYVLHETEFKAELLREIWRVLKPGGTFLLIDWKRQAEEHGPPVEIRVTEEEAEKLLEEAGFTVTSRAELNPSHYSITSIKSGVKAG